MPFALIPFLLLAIPLMEIAAFVVVGSQIGVAATLGLVLLTAIAGSILLRWQGFGLIGRILLRATAHSRGSSRDGKGGAAVLVVAGDGPVRRTFVLTGMDRVLPIHSTRQSAIQAVGHPGPGCG